MMRKVLTGTRSSVRRARMGSGTRRALRIEKASYKSTRLRLRICKPTFEPRMVAVPRVRSCASTGPYAP